MTAITIQLLQMMKRRERAEIRDRSSATAQYLQFME